MNEAAMTIVKNSHFKNNFGTEGGSLSLIEGGAMIAISNNFTMSERYSTVPD